MDKMAVISGAAFAALTVSACGGSGGSGVASPPPPPPAPTYTKIADLTGNQTFETATQNYQVNQSGATGFGTSMVEDYGTGSIFAYNEASDTFTLTDTTARSVEFNQTTVVAAQTTANRTVFDRNDIANNRRDIFSLTTPQVNGTDLEYMRIASWNKINTATGETFIDLMVGGVPTIASDIPTTTTVQYDTAIGGAVYIGAQPYSVSDANSTVTFSVNFGTGDITTDFTLAGTPFGGGALTDLGTVEGRGQINSGGPGISGNFNNGMGSLDSVIGGFNGAFFGPQAVEFGYNWYLEGPNVSGVGQVVGRK